MTGYPQVGLASFPRLLASLAEATVRSGDWRPGWHRWVRAQTKRHGAADLVVNVLGRRFLLVNGAALSAEILRDPPRSDRFVSGVQRRKSMAFLAPHALTISAGDDWTRLRGYHEQVLATGRPHEYREEHLQAIHAAFALPVGSVDAVRRAMGNLMLQVVFGRGAPAALPKQVRELMGVVGSPARRIVLGRAYRARRARLYRAIRGQWEGAAPGSLVGGFRDLGVPPSTESLEQVPHWMFTFVLSGTELLTRSLALIGSRPEALFRVRAEIEAAGPLGEAASIDRLAYLEACISEAGRLFPPVKGTSHRAPRGADVDGHRIPAGMRVVHYFPMANRDTAADPTADDFVPERWLDPRSEAFERYPNLFLSGARRCPGRDLIMFVCKSAIAIQVGRHGVSAQARPLRSDPLPLSFPARRLRFVRS